MCPTYLVAIHTNNCNGNLIVTATACLLQLTEVITACCSFLKKQLHSSNCLGIRQFAELHGCHDLLTVAHEYTTVGTYIQPLGLNDHLPQGSTF